MSTGDPVDIISKDWWWRLARVAREFESICNEHGVTMAAIDMAGSDGLSVKLYGQHHNQILRAIGFGDLSNPSRSEFYGDNAWRQRDIVAKLDGVSFVAFEPESAELEGSGGAVPF